MTTSAQTSGSKGPAKQRMPGLEIKTSMPADSDEPIQVRLEFSPEPGDRTPFPPAKEIASNSA